MLVDFCDAFVWNDCRTQKLYDVHSRFLSELTRAGAAPDNVDVISDKFITFKEEFLVYGEYCSHLPMAQKLLETYQKSNPPAHERILVNKLIQLLSYRVSFNGASAQLYRLLFQGYGPFISICFRQFGNGLFCEKIKVVRHEKNKPYYCIKRRKP